MIVMLLQYHHIYQTKDALSHNLEVVYCDNIPIPLDDSQDLKKSIMKLVYEAVEDYEN